MAIPVIESYSITDITSNTNTWDAVAPSGITDDDILILIVSLDGTGANPTASGFTLIVSNDANGVDHAIFYKRASSESGNYTVNWTGSEQGYLTIYRISGCITTGSPVDQSPTGHQATGTGITVTGLTSTVIDTLALAFVTVDSQKVDGADTVSGTGWTEIGVSQNRGNNFGCGIISASAPMASISTVADAVFGTWGSDGLVANMINLKPPVAAGGFAYSQGVIIG